jgi:uncharacterized SAM-binding protein YcdF (DUF218 family)
MGFRRDRTRLSQRVLAVGALLFLLAFCTPIGEILIGNLEGEYPPVLAPQPLSENTTIVVLSAHGVEDQHTPVTSNLGDETVYRLVEGLRIYRAMPAAKIIVSGGVVRKGDKPIAELMGEFLIALGVPKNDVLIENRSRDTAENLSSVRHWVAAEPYYLVTSSYHLRRAVGVARKLGMRPVPCPAFVKTLQFHPRGRTWSQWSLQMFLSFGFPSRDRINLIQRSFHEYVGYAWYRATGRI